MKQIEKQLIEKQLRKKLVEMFPNNNDILKIAIRAHRDQINTLRKGGKGANELADILEKQKITVTTF